jgi:hypothetical protein
MDCRKLNWDKICSLRFEKAPAPARRKADQKSDFSKISVCEGSRLRGRGKKLESFAGWGKGEEGEKPANLHLATGRLFLCSSSKGEEIF